MIGKIMIMYRYRGNARNKGFQAYSSQKCLLIQGNADKSRNSKIYKKYSNMVK